MLILRPEHLQADFVSLVTVLGEGQYSFCGNVWIAGIGPDGYAKRYLCESGQVPFGSYLNRKCRESCHPSGRKEGFEESLQQLYYPRHIPEYSETFQMTDMNSMV